MIQGENGIKNKCKIRKCHPFKEQWSKTDLHTSSVMVYGQQNSLHTQRTLYAMGDTHGPHRLTCVQNVISPFFFKQSPFLYLTLVLIAVFTIGHQDPIVFKYVKIISVRAPVLKIYPDD